MTAARPDAGPEEPHLRPEDLRLVEIWRGIALQHARTTAHLAAVDRAKRVVEMALARAPRLACMWSGGKDSTVLTHLLCVEMGLKMPVYSEKDDLDYPGERAYVEGLGAAWGLDLRVLVPSLSPTAWMAEHGAKLNVDSDFHGRAAALSKACFYEVVESATADYDGVVLGLRQDESRGRAIDRAMHWTLVDGAPMLDLYQRRSGRALGQWRVSPLGSWKGIDVMAYAAARGIDVLHVYRCIAFLPEHRREPWRVRKSWWIAVGANAQLYGGVAWLAHYYPILYAKMRAWMPSAQGYR